MNCYIIIILFYQICEVLNLATSEFFLCSCIACCAGSLTGLSPVPRENTDLSSPSRNNLTACVHDIVYIYIYIYIYYGVYKLLRNIACVYIIAAYIVALQYNCIYHTRSIPLSVVVLEV